MIATQNRRKISALFLLSVLLVQITACAVQKQSVAVKPGKPFTLLAMGDSITEGGPDFFSYLFPLDSLLESAGYRASFIGPRQSVRNGDTLHHAGYSGRTAEYLAARADSIYSLYPADIVLLHSGHNHFIEEVPIPGIIAAQRTIIQTIRKRNPSAVILVAAVITAGKLPKYAYIPELNTAISEMVISMHDDKVRFVNQQNGWNWVQYTIHDKVHPNQAGAAVIAARWYNAISNLSNK
jgi:lysophospholipase L1-like esterase